MQIGVFLCSARNNLLCDTLQGLEFVAACVQVGCFTVLHQRKFFNADSTDGREVNSGVSVPWFGLLPEDDSFYM